MWENDIRNNVKRQAEKLHKMHPEAWPELAIRNAEEYERTVELIGKHQAISREYSVAAHQWRIEAQRQRC